MSRLTHDVHRSFDVITLTIYDRRKDTARHAIYLAWQMVEPWEVMREPRKDAGGAWVIEVDRERSDLRKEVIDTVLVDLDETDRVAGNGLTTTSLYLGRLRDTLDILEEAL